jgi:hypothetical protein
LETLSNNVKAQEAAQKAQQSRRPAFELYVKSSHGGRHPVTSEGYFPSEQAEYSGGPKASVVFDVENTGDKDVTNVKLSLKAESEFVLECDQYDVEKIAESLERGATEILVNLKTIRANHGHKSVRCSASKSIVVDYVTLYLGIEADQLPNMVSFPAIIVANTRNKNHLPREH